MDLDRRRSSSSGSLRRKCHFEYLTSGRSRDLEPNWLRMMMMMMMMTMMMMMMLMMMMVMLVLVVMVVVAMVIVMVEAYDE